MSSARLGPCTACENPNSPRCERCNSAFYCSKACQRIDWPIHGILCPSFAAFDISRGPTPEHFRAIRFPPKKKEPKFIWIHCKWRQDSGRRYQSPETAALVGSGCGIERANLFLGPRLNKQLNNTIVISFRDSSMIDASEPSKSIASITATKPGFYYGWRGPITAFGQSGTTVNEAHCRDLDMNDWRYIAIFFLSPVYVPLYIRPQKVPKGASTNGVMISLAVLFSLLLSFSWFTTKLQSLSKPPDGHGGVLGTSGSLFGNTEARMI
ncbi:hypothetical protein PG994_008000 [Apiospora phragmitis]|uniref:MYND-type domain-containing protein n=1 Tax=Apiospora phragmitis TaxID=2905665 RepID=A0ABR1URT2_9PEZI